MLKIASLAFAVALSNPAQARNLFTTLADPSAKTWKTTNSPDLRFCIITSLANKTGQASTVVEKGGETIVIVHNWSSPVPGDDVRGIFVIKPDGVVDFKGQKMDLVQIVEHCNRL